MGEKSLVVDCDVFYIEVDDPSDFAGGGGRDLRNLLAFDPGAFAGPTSGRFSDRFIAGSSAAPQPYQPQIDLSVAQPFYGGSRGATPITPQNGS